MTVAYLCVRYYLVNEPHWSIQSGAEMDIVSSGSLEFDSHLACAKVFAFLGIDYFPSPAFLHQN